MFPLLILLFIPSSILSTTMMSFDNLMDTHNNTLFVKLGTYAPGGAFCGRVENSGSVYTHTPAEHSMNFHISSSGCPCGVEPYKMTDYDSRQPFGSYGYYGVVMKAPSGDTSGIFMNLGVQSSDGTDQIAIEILGKSTSTLDYGCKVGGSWRYAESELSLGFDTANAYHELGFVWTDSFVQWYADGISLGPSAYTTETPPLGTGLGFFILFWPHCGTSDGWLGLATFTPPLEMRIQRIRYYRGWVSYPEWDVIHDHGEPNSTDNTTDPNGDDPSNDDKSFFEENMLYFVIGLASSAGVLLILVVIIVVMCLIFCCCKNRSDGIPNQNHKQTRQQQQRQPSVTDSPPPEIRPRINRDAVPGPKRSIVPPVRKNVRPKVKRNVVARPENENSKRPRNRKASVQAGNVKKFSKPHNTLEEIALLENRETCDSMASFRINRALFTIDIDDLQVQKSLGRGGFATVWLADYLGSMVAFKCFDTKLLCSTQDNFDDFERELELMSSLSHPNLITFYGCTLCPPRVGIVMEYCALGPVNEYLTSHQDTSMRERFRFLTEMSRCMVFLHGKEIIHRDLKPENILLNSSKSIKIIDLGLSKMIDRISQSHTSNIGTSAYIAPEVFKGTKYSQSCDVFAFGVITFAVCSGQFKVYGGSNYYVQGRVAANPHFRPQSRKLTLLCQPPPNRWLKNLISRCWDDDPSIRPDFREVGRILKKNIPNWVET